MNRIDPLLESRLKALLWEVAEFVKNGASIVSDIFVNVKTDDLMVTFSDDMGQPFLQTTVDELDILKTEDDFNEAIVGVFRSVLREEKMVALWEDLSEASGSISFVLVDDEGETIEDITTFDKDLIILDESFLEKIDKELDEFYNRLMADVK